MIGELEAVLFGDLTLTHLYLRIFELHDLAAHFADQVIVVGFVAQFEFLALCAEGERSGQLVLFEQVEGAVDGGDAGIEFGILLFDQQVEILGCEVVGMVVEGAQDRFALSGEFEIVAAQDLLEGEQQLVVAE